VGVSVGVGVGGIGVGVAVAVGVGVGGIGVGVGVFKVMAARGFSPGPLFTLDVKCLSGTACEITWLCSASPAFTTNISFLKALIMGSASAERIPGKMNTFTISRIKIATAFNSERRGLLKIIFDISISSSTY
jgi:hypothetical protein